MKKLVVILVVVFGIACNSNGTINETKIDFAGEKLQHTVEKTADTIANKVGRWTDSLHNDHDTTY